MFSTLSRKTKIERGLEYSEATRSRMLRLLGSGAIGDLGFKNGRTKGARGGDGPDGEWTCCVPY